MKPELRARLMETHETVRNVCAGISFSRRALETRSNGWKIAYLFIRNCGRVSGVCFSCISLIFLAFPLRPHANDNQIIVTAFTIINLHKLTIKRLSKFDSFL